MRLVRDNEGPLFDYVFLDGAHSWAADALAFVLIDRLLEVGGFIDLDDYAWSFARSMTQNPMVRPAIRELYTDEQIETPQVALVVDLLIRRDGRYEEVVADKIFRKAR